MPQRLDQFSYQVAISPLPYRLVSVENGYWDINPGSDLYRWMTAQVWYHEQNWDWDIGAKDDISIIFGFTDLKIATEFKLRWT